jgi:hypothetical protein
MRRPVAITLLALQGFAACALVPGHGNPAPEPTPVRGEVPKAIAIWPLLAPDFQAAHELLLPPLERALQERGYRVVPAAVAQELLAGCAAATPQQAPGEVARLLAVDAVMQFVVRDFAATGTRPLGDARWDFEWRLVSMPTGVIVWSWTERGTWVPHRGDSGDPNRPLGAEPDVVPFGGTGEFIYRDARELVASLHLIAMSHLPSRAK